MTKPEAASFLGVSVRALERYTQQNRVAARYEKGKTSNIIVYDEAELERFKSELERPTHKPSIERSDSTQSAIDAGAKAPGENSNQSLVNIAKPMTSFGEPSELASFLLQLMNAMQIAHASPALPAPEEDKGKRAHEKPHTPTEAKLLLSVEEAMSLTGLSRAVILEAVKEGQLVAKKSGRAWRIKRRDLDAFVDAF